MRRRDVLTLGCGVVAFALPVRAQHLAVIGYLGSESPDLAASRLKAFRDGLAQTGYAEGRNVAIEFRWAQGQYRRLPALATELVQGGVDVIVAPGGAEVALAAKSATTTIPIVFEMGGDPVALGVVGSLSRPAGNVTGVTSLSVEVSRKRLETMQELLPNAGRFAIALNPNSPTSAAQWRNLQEAAAKLGVRIDALYAADETQFDALFSAASSLQARGLVFTSDPYLAYRSAALAALAVRHAVPAITQSRDFTRAGGLMSYGGDFQQSHRQAGLTVGRILNGEKPSELPVQQVTRVELLINLKAAQVLGLTFPPSILSRADDVIE